MSDYNTRQAEILRLHHDVGIKSRSSKAGAFISSWKSSHPFGNDYLRPLTENVGSSVDILDYAFLSDETETIFAVKEFHKRQGEKNASDQECLIVPGSSNAIASVAFLLAEFSENREILFADPIYHTFYLYSQKLGFNLRSAGRNPLHSCDDGLNLPNQSSVLLLVDPIWVAGVGVRDSVYAEIADWQHRTGSIVIIDGTFGYTEWNRSNPYLGAERLDPNRTIRIVCPTKSLSVHGIRFAYILLPESLRTKVRYFSAVLSGACSAFDIAASKVLIHQLLTKSGNRKLVKFITERYSALLNAGVIEECLVDPHSSYFFMAKVSDSLKQVSLTMTEDFFWLSGGREYVRLNILSPFWERALDEVGG